MRFPGFETAWEKKSVGKVISIKSDKYNPDTDESEFSCIELESLSQGTGELLLTFSSKNQKSTKNVFNSGDVLFGKLRPYLRKFYLVDFKGVCSSEIWVMNSTVFNPLYLYAYVQSNRFLSLTEITSGSKMPRADWNLISASVIRYPKEFKEREKIGDLFRLINERIHTQSKIIEDYQLLKKGVAQKLFKQNIKFKDEKGNPYPKWEKRKLREVFDYEQPTKYLVSDTDYDDDYETPVLTAGKTFLLGYTNETEGIFEDKLPTIIFDDFTTAFQYVDFPFKAKSSAMKMLIPKNEKVNIKFVFEAMRTIKFPLAEHKRYWISEYQNEKISYPCQGEQKKIASILFAIDNKIVLETELLEQFKIQKRFFLQNLFI